MIQFYAVIVTGTMNLNAILGSANKLINSSATGSLVHPTMSHTVFVIKRVFLFSLFWKYKIRLEVQSNEMQLACKIN